MNAAKEKLVMPEADPPLAENSHSCGSAVFPNFRGGIFSEKCARSIFKIQHK